MGGSWSLQGPPIITVAVAIVPALRYEHRRENWRALRGTHNAGSGQGRAEGRGARSPDVRPSTARRAAPTRPWRRWRGFPPTDPLYASVSKCYDVTQELHVRAHYASCKGGVGNVRESMT